MDDKTHTFEQIAAYLADELDQETRQAFEQQMETDASLTEAVNQQRTTHQAVDLYAQLQTKARVEALHQQLKERQASPYRSWLAIAASVALLIVAGLTYWYNLNQYSTETLVADQLSAYPDRITTMSSTSDEQVAVAMAAYNTGNFAEAADLFAALPAEANPQDLLQLYQGIALLYTDRPQQALERLQHLAPDSPYQEAARWYQALALLALDREMEVRTLLQEIVAEGAYPSDQAEELLKDLDSWWR